MLRRRGVRWPLTAAVLLLASACTGQGSASDTDEGQESGVGAAGGVAAAGPDAGPQGPRPVATPASTERAAGDDLVVWADGDLAAAVRPFAERFGAKHGVKVVVEAESDLHGHLTETGSTGQGPDVFLGAHQWLGELTQRHAIVPVPLSSRAQAAFAPSSMKAVRYDGRVWGVPYAIENLALVRNTKLAPQAPTSFEQMLATGRSLQKHGRVKQVLIQETGSTGDVYAGYPYLRAFGGGIFGTTPSHEYSAGRLEIDDPASIKGARVLAELGDDGVLSTEVDNRNSSALFGAGDAAYYVTGPWSAPALRAAKIPYAVSPLPPMDGGGNPQPLLDVDLFYVSATARKPSVAQEFVADCATRKDLQVALAKAGDRPPALTSAYQQLAPKDAAMTGWFEAGRHGDPVPSLPAMQAVWGPLGQAFADIVDGADPAKRLPAAAREIEAAES